MGGHGGHGLGDFGKDSCHFGHVIPKFSESTNIQHL